MSIWSERIKQKRIENNLTLSEVSKKLGVTEATAQRYESGSIKSVPYDHICKYAELLNCSPAYIMGWEKQQENVDNINSVIKNDRIKRMLAYCKNFDDETLDDILEYMEFKSQKDN